MKKALSFFAIMMTSMLMLASSAFAAAQLPSTSVWFDPAGAASGAPITLNALVYNNQSVAATITVVFTTDTSTKVGTVTEDVASQTAKTFSAAWKMPTKNTIVTATVTAATNSSKKSLPALVGPLGSVTVGTVTPLITGVTLPSFSGSAQLMQRFAPLIATLEAFRVQQAAHFTQLENTTRARIGLNPAAFPQVFQQPPEVPAPADQSAPVTTTPVTANTPNILGNPIDYLTYAYATAFAALFANQMVFYIVLILIILLLLRFIVNRIF